MILLESHEACPGMLVRVKHDNRRLSQPSCLQQEYASSLDNGFGSQSRYPLWVIGGERRSRVPVISIIPTAHSYVDNPCRRRIGQNDPKCEALYPVGNIRLYQGG